MTTQWLLGWWNLIFLAPFFLALLYLCLYSLTGISFGEPDADLDGDVDSDFDADGDLHLDGDLHADAHLEHDWDADSDLEHDAGSGHGESLGQEGEFDQDSDLDHEAPGERVGGAGPGYLSALAWLGVGRVPLSLLFMFLLLTWGALGFMSNYLLARQAARPDRAVLLSFAIAVVGSVLMTRLLVRLMGRYLPLNETSARRRHELLGNSGEALYPINDHFGLVAVRDDRGELYQVPCRVEAGGADIAKGAVVRLVGYSAKEKLFYVVRRGDGGGVPTA